jgi:hypothetical protein
MGYRKRGKGRNKSPEDRSPEVGERNAKSSYAEALKEGTTYFIGA